MACYAYHGLGGPWVGFHGLSFFFQDIRRMKDDLSIRRNTNAAALVILMVMYTGDTSGSLDQS